MGTTSLFRYLSQHPDISGLKLKEPRFFATDFMKESEQYHRENNTILRYKQFFPIRNLNDYQELIQANQEPYILDSSVQYLHSKEAAKNIYNYNKDAKIIMLFREPASFLHSVYKQMFPHYETAQTFEKALSLEQDRRDGHNIPKTMPYPKMSYYYDRLKYATQLKRYLQYFPPENIKVILYEDFKKDNKKTINEICDFLSIKRAEIDVSQNINVTKNKEIKYSLIRWLKRVYSDPYIRRTMFYRILRRFIPKTIRVKLWPTIMHLSKRRKSKNELTNKLKKKIKKDCYDEIKEFNRLLKEHNLSDEDVMKKWNMTLNEDIS